jgi:hypothetical protein
MHSHSMTRANRLNDLRRRCRDRAEGWERIYAQDPWLNWSGPKMAAYWRARARGYANAFWAEVNSRDA